MKKLATLSIKYEILKYKRRGRHTFVGLALLILMVLSLKYMNHTLLQFLIEFLSPTWLSGPTTGVLHILSYIGFNLFFCLCYFLEHPLIEQYKCNKNNWPWKEENQWSILLNATIIGIAFNILLIGPLFILIGSSFLNQYDTSLENLPSMWKICLHLIFCFLCNDLVFHFTHKLLHTKYLYKMIHYKHHQYSNPIGISAEYAHPIEYILGNGLPALIGPFLLGPQMHVITLWTWTIFGIGATIEQHSGYEFPFSPYGILPFTFNASYHDFHHTRFKYNFSSNFIFLDLLFGDNKKYFEYLEKASIT